MFVGRNSNEMVEQGMVSPKSWRKKYEEHASIKENDPPGSADGSLGDKIACTVGTRFV